MKAFAEKGSQKWLQIAVNRNEELLLAALRRSGAVGREVAVEWRSPLRTEDFQEYRDEHALKKLEVVPHELKRSLETFWPRRGPVWDALGITTEKQPLLLEAKAHIPEVASPGTRASDQSGKLIDKALGEARRHFAPRATAAWDGVFYQYANRLAHQFFLRELNNVQSTLVFLYFTNASDVEGPACEDEWHGAIRLIHAVLGLPADLRKFGIFDVFLDVRQLK